MRRLISSLFVVLVLTWCSLARAEPVTLQDLSGEWRQTASNAGKCADCRIVVEENGPNFSVKASNGWSAVVRPASEGQPFVAGQGSWKPDSGGVYGGKAFRLNLAIVDGRLLMLMTVPGPDGTPRNIKATFEKRSAPGKAI